MIRVKEPADVWNTNEALKTVDCIHRSVRGLFLITLNNILHSRHSPPKSDLRTGSSPPSLLWKGLLTTMELVI